MYHNKTITVNNKKFYNRNNCEFVFCNSCYWCATILKVVYDIGKCPICRKNKLYVQNI
jgi:hypothetical protein